MHTSFHRQCCCDQDFALVAQIIIIIIIIIIINWFCKRTVHCSIGANVRDKLSIRLPWLSAKHGELLCSNACGGWFASRARHSVRMTYRPSAALQLLGSLRIFGNKFLRANKWILILLPYPYSFCLDLASFWNIIRSVDWGCKNFLRITITLK